MQVYTKVQTIGADWSFDPLATKSHSFRVEGTHFAEVKLLKNV